MVVVREQKGDRVLQTAEELHKKMVTSSIFFVKVLTATSYEKKYCNLWNLLLFISNKVHLRLVLCYFSIYYYLSEQRWDTSSAAPVPRVCVTPVGPDRVELEMSERSQRPCLGLLFETRL